MELNDFIAQLEGFGQRLEDQAIRDITVELAQVQAELQGRAPRSTGALANSIRIVPAGRGVELQMLDYGYFQNYGVIGTSGANPGVDPIPDPPASLFGKTPGNTFRFGTGGKGWGAYYSGIRAQRWFDLQGILDQVQAIVENTPAS